MLTQKQIGIACGLGLFAASLSGCTQSAPPASVQTPASSAQMRQTMQRDMTAPGAPVPKAHN